MSNQKDQWIHVDRPAVMETFCDYVQSCVFDGQTMRLEFCVDRIDEPPPGPKEQELTGKRYTCARLVLTAEAGRDLYLKLNKVAQEIQDQQEDQPLEEKTH